MSTPAEIDPRALPRRNNPAFGKLCLNCGLCCDGSLFYGVDLEDSEVEAATLNGLDPVIEQDGVRFRQPCRRFNSICEIYPERPLRCRKYRCVLLKRLERYEVDEQSAYAIVEEARRLVSEADRASLPGEDRGASRRRWEMAFKAQRTNGTPANAETFADPHWLVAMTALNYYLDRYFRSPRHRRIVS